MRNPYRETADSLEGHWHKGSLGDGDGNRCLIGHAIDRVGQRLDRTGEWDDFVTLLEQTMQEQLPGRGIIIANINDHPDTTEEEVLTVLDKAAVRWDERI